MSKPGNASKNGNLLSGQHQRTYATFVAAVDLTREVPGVLFAASGGLLNVTTAGNFVWKDCAGVTNTLPLPIGVFQLPWALATIEISTVLGALTVYWHA